MNKWHVTSYHECKVRTVSERYIRLLSMLDMEAQQPLRNRLNTSFPAPLLLARLPQLGIPISDRAFSIWSFNANKVVLFADFLNPAHKIPPLFNDIAQLTQPLDVNMLYNIHVVKELMQLTVRFALYRKSNVGLFFRILSRLLHQSLMSMSMPLRHKEAHGE